MSDPKVSAREAARMIGKTERTVRRWIDRKQLAAERDSTSGEFRIRVADLAPWIPEEAPEPEYPEVKAPELADAIDRLAVVTAEGWVERAIRAEMRVEMIRGLLTLEPTGEMASLRRLIGILAGDAE